MTFEITLHLLTMDKINSSYSDITRTQGGTFVSPFFAKIEVIICYNL